MHFHLFSVVGKTTAEERWQEMGEKSFAGYKLGSFSYRNGLRLDIETAGLR